MHRTQILLTDAQYTRLREESTRSGRPLAELVRQALDARYEPIPSADRLRLLDSAFGGWRGRSEDGRQFVERVRTGTERRLNAHR